MVRAVATRIYAGVRYGSNSGFGAPKLGPPEVSHILRKNELAVGVNVGSVSQLALNQLPSNDPIEDRLMVAQNRLTTGATFGVFDGHGGSRMAQIVSQRIPHYFALSVLPRQRLEEYVQAKETPKLVKQIFCVDELSEWQKECHQLSLKRFAEDLLKSTERHTTSELLSKSFDFLDAEISQEIQARNDEEALTLAVQGCVATVAHVTDQHLYVASTGDCRAVLGMCDENGRWSARALNVEHDCNNVEELQRILGEHPPGEKNYIIRGERLLGNLAPLRAFGDFNLKWTRDELNSYLVPVYGKRVIPPHYVTPPYLTANPEVTHHILTPRDKFLIIASDGLWEKLGTQKVVQFVGQFMQGNQTPDLLRAPDNITLGALRSLLSKRKADLSQKPVDTNAATHLIRHALGRTEYGLEHSRLATYLGYPADVVRDYRDDISILVIFFDQQQLKNG